MKWRWLAAALLLIMFGLLISTLPFTSPTADEPMYMVRGYAFVSRGQDRMVGCSPCSPVLSSALSGVALLLEPQLKPLPPETDPTWQDDGGTGIFEYFVWSDGAPTQRIIFLARLPILFVTVLLGALIFRWAAQRSGAAAALGVLALAAFDPNLLAHGRLVTADVVTAATFTLGAYAFDQAVRTARGRWRALSGVALGLALASKVSAVALPVAWIVWAIIATWPRRRDRSAWRASIVTLGWTIGLGLVTLWGLYRFSIGPIVPGGLSALAPAYWADWQAVLRNQTAPLPAYLFGQMSTQGWWYYYPLTFLLKTPLPVLIVIGLMFVTMWRARRWADELPLLIAPAAIFGGLLFSAHDLGYRYVLPVLPFLLVASASVFAAVERRRWFTVALIGLLAWQIIGTLRLYPYYLAFFNEAAGGPENGRFVLSDSNLDWGQDLPGLKTYLDQHLVTDFNFSYFGGIDPAVYGLHGYALPPVRAAMHTQGAWWLHRFYPLDPAPGRYAISASNLMGGAWIDPGEYAFFRDQTPAAVIGHSIYLYTIAPRGAAANLSLAGLQMDQIDPQTYQHFGTNDVRPRWFDPAGALIAAPGESWIAVADDQAFAPEFQGFFAGEQPITRAKVTDEDRTYAVYHFDLDQRLIVAAQQTPSVTGTVTFGETATLIGYQFNRTADGLTLVTFWRAGNHIGTPLQMFVHVLDAQANIVAQVDRLDASPFGWRAGDIIVQLHRLAAPPSAAQIVGGMYNIESGQRLPIVVDGRTVDQFQLAMPEAK